MYVVAPLRQARALVALILMLLLITPGAAHPPEDSNDTRRVPVLPVDQPIRSSAMLISPADSSAADAIHPALPDATIVHQHAPQSGVGAGNRGSEARALAGVTYVVTTTLDSGPGSLRQQILDANASPGADSVHFAIPGNDVQTIRSLSALPVITDTLTIDGSTQPGASCAAWPPTIRVVLEGSPTADPFTDGIKGDAPQVVIRGLNIQGFRRDGIFLQGGSGHQLQCLLVGTSVDGTSSRGNGRDGIRIADATDTQIGGTELGQSNLVAGNTGKGIFIISSGEATRTQAARNHIEGNLIGTDHTGTITLSNNIGVSSQDAIDTYIGGTVAGAGNLISGNREEGVLVISSGFAGTLPSAGVRIEGNRIGTDANGTTALGNAISGVMIQDSPGTVIGGTAAGAGNTISGNGGRGIVISSTGNAGRPLSADTRIEGNRIGTNASGTAALGNAISGVQIQDTPGAVIGGTAAGAGNTISGNGTNGILILSTGDAGRPPATNIRIEGNRIGTNASGTTALGNTTHGIQVIDTPGTVIGGTAAGAGNTISGNGANGIFVPSNVNGNPTSANTRIEGNRIGTDGTGSTGLGNKLAGVWIQRSPDNVIGGTTAGAGNTISANGQHGVVVLSSNGTIIEDNRVGTDQTGASGLGNTQYGIFVEDSASTRVGGTTAGAGNTISANGQSGIVLFSSGAPNTTPTSGTIVQGNMIGTDATGSVALGNTTAGVEISDAQNNLIGGTAAGAGNTIRGNLMQGVLIQTWGEPNTFPSTENRIVGNRISHNGRLGIDLNGDGATRNDLLDADSGTNKLQNTPILTDVVIESSGISVTGRLHSTPSMTFTLDFYGNSVENAPDGEVPLGQQTVTTDASGNATFSVQFPYPANTPPLLAVTATATDPQGNTSELFAPIPQRVYLPLIRR